jgi:LacI family transcriptional regulator
MGLDPEDDETRRLVASGVACAGVDVEISGLRSGYVISDNDAGIRLAMRHLHDLGHRRIATITGLVETRPGAERLRAYRDALRDLGLGYRDEYVAYGDFYVESGRQAMLRLLRGEEPPTAVVAASDLMALGALRAAAEEGVSVPGDVSLVGFDDIQLAGHVNPPLTTVRQDKAGLGAAAGALLRRNIDGDADGQPVTTLPVELVVRESTAPPPAGA